MAYEHMGKEVLYKGSGASVHIADAADNEKAHFLATAANEYRDFDYATEAEKTCSIVWNPHYVEQREFNRTLALVISQAENMNLFKKLFFRGKTPDDVGFEMPEANRSLGPLLDRCSPEEINIIHGIVGVITEAGEMAELLMAFIEGRPFDRVHLLEEGGDVEWYQHRILRGIGATSLMRDRANIDKLHGRHGDAFDVFRDANRDLSNERTILEEAALPLLEDVVTQGIVKPVAHGEMADMIDKIAEVAHTPRARNDPALPPGVTVENVGNVERHHKTNVGDCEGMDC